MNIVIKIAKEYYSKYEHSSAYDRKSIVFKVFKSLIVTGIAFNVTLKKVFEVEQHPFQNVLFPTKKR